MPTDPVPGDGAPDQRSDTEPTQGTTSPPDPRDLLKAWGLEDAPCTLVATRENRVYRVTTPDGPAALRLRRPGLRSAAELQAELDWTAALAAGGLQVPAPHRTRTGTLSVQLADITADLVTWIEGQPMGIDGQLAALTDPEATYHALGRRAAQLHALCDGWTPPQGFDRHAWDAQGLLGETPVWGRFWENPLLDASARALIDDARARATLDLAALAPELDYGLIHADLTPENVILTVNGPALIDFDDGGWGFRAFELATTANRAMRHPAGESLTAALVAGYQTHRAFDPAVLPLFGLLRAFTYLGWIIPRMAEPGAHDRAARFASFATARATSYLET